VDESADGINGGRNGGRICWAVAGHFASDGEVRCATAAVLVTCMACEFFKQVIAEEGIYNIELVRPIEFPKQELAGCEVILRDHMNEG
jgi:hypothetical protein